MQECSLFSIPSSAFIVCRLFDNGHSGQCERLPQCSFDLHFSNDEWGFPGCSDSKESACNVRDLGSIPWVGKLPWRRAWQLTPVFLPEESPWTEEPDGLQSMGSQRVGHD